MVIAAIFDRFEWPESDPGEVRVAFNWIHLPAQQEQLMALLPCPACAEFQNRETILVVEDDELVLRFTRLALEAQGYTVLTACDGADATQLVEEQGGAIHMLLTDVVMPRMNGLVLAESLERKEPRIKVLFMSGYAEAILRGGLLPREVNYLSKPYSVEILARKVREVLDGK